MEEGWTKYTEDYSNDKVQVKWGEGEDKVENSKVTKHKWQEKLERECDYWERYYEEETRYMVGGEKMVNEYAVRSGAKEFRNNRGYYMREEWRELNDGNIKVERLVDDGMGKKTTENYNAIKKAGQVEKEYSNDLIDDIAHNKKTVVDKGRNHNELQEEWENHKITDFVGNFEMIAKRGKNKDGMWNEQWYEREGTEKWAKKEGVNFITQD